MLYAIITQNDTVVNLDHRHLEAHYNTYLYKKTINSISAIHISHLMLDFTNEKVDVTLYF